MSAARPAAAVSVTGTLLAVLVSAGCSADGEAGAGATPGSPPPSTVPATASTPSGEPTGSLAPATPEASTPATSRTSPVSVPTTGGHVGGDVDGDGEPDELAVVDAAGAWEVVVTATTDGELRAVLPDEAGLLGDPSVAGSSDLDQDGYGEVWVRSPVGVDASMSWVVRYDGERLAALTRPGTGDTPVVEGSSVANELVVWCDGPVLWWADVARSDPGAESGDTASVLRISYEISGFTWREVTLDQREAVALADVEDLVGGAGCMVPVS